MKTLRSLYLAAILAIGLGVTFGAPSAALAGDRITAPGEYDASVVYIPGISVPGGLPACVDEFAQQIYVGKLTVAQKGGGYTLSFEGVNDADSKLKVKATASFNASWGGFLLGKLGGREDALMGIDVANLVSGRVSGRILGANGAAGHLNVKVGAGGTIETCRLTGPAAH